MTLMWPMSPIDGARHTRRVRAVVPPRARETARERWRRRSDRCARPFATRANAEAGNALVETAVAMPLLLLVVLGLLQFALYAHAAHVVTTAVQVGARWAAADGQPLQAAVGRTQDILRAGLGSEAAALAVQARDGGEVVSVEARGRLRLIIPWVGDASLPLDARAVATKERFRPGGSGVRGV
jgi:hypothetical protein